MMFSICCKSGRFALFVGLLSMGSALFVGCGSSGPPRIAVHGQVTCGGEPVPTGQVRFVPLEETDGPTKSALMAVISDGEYKVTTLGGLTPGSYRVEVDARRTTGKKVEINVGFETTMGDETVPIAPEKYNGPESPLKLSLTEDSDAQFDIELSKREE